MEVRGVNDAVYHCAFVTCECCNLPVIGNTAKVAHMMRRETAVGDRAAVNIGARDRAFHAALEGDAGNAGAGGGNLERTAIILCIDNHVIEVTRQTTEVDGSREQNLRIDRVGAVGDDDGAAVPGQGDGITDRRCGGCPVRVWRGCRRVLAYDIEGMRIDREYVRAGRLLAAVVGRLDGDRGLPRLVEAELHADAAGLVDAVTVEIPDNRKPGGVAVDYGRERCVVLVNGLVGVAREVHGESIRVELDRADVNAASHHARLAEQIGRACHPIRRDTRIDGRR